MDGVSTLSAVAGIAESEPDSSSLSLAMQASSFRAAVDATADLRRVADTPARVSSVASTHDGRREWRVTLTTPPVPLKLELIRSLEEEMLAIERRRPGCRFLGWRTGRATQLSTGSVVGTPGDDAAGEMPRQTQRELVVASLLRRPADERGGIVRGRAAPR